MVQFEVKCQCKCHLIGNYRASITSFGSLLCVSQFL